MQFAKEKYFGEAGPFGAYDYKAIAEATFFGVPNYVIGATGQIATPPPPPAPNPAAGTQSTALSVN